MPTNIQPTLKIVNTNLKSFNDNNLEKVVILNLRNNKLISFNNNNLPNLRYFQIDGNNFSNQKFIKRRRIYLLYETQNENNLKRKLEVCLRCKKIISKYNIINTRPYKLINAKYSLNSCC